MTTPAPEVRGVGPEVFVGGEEGVQGRGVGADVPQRHDERVGGRDLRLADRVAVHEGYRR